MSRARQITLVVLLMFAITTSLANVVVNPAAVQPALLPYHSAPQTFKLPSGYVTTPERIPLNQLALDARALALSNPLPTACSQIGSSGNYTEQCTYGYTGSTQSLSLPSGLTSVHVSLSGAGGAGSGNGAGGKISGTLAVSGGSTLSINVGGAGNGDNGGTGGAGGWPDGGSGGSGHNGGGGGGGSSSIYVNGTRMIAAGGGGSYGGYGSGQGSSTGGTGGATAANGGNGSNGGGSCNGYGGTAGASGGGGGSGSNYGACSVDQGGGGSSGSSSSGGSGGGGSGASGSGGGGGGAGGGWLGGGGGGGGSTDSSGGGGAGGSDGYNGTYVSGVTDTPGGGAGPNSAGSVTVSWPLATPSVQLTGSASSANAGAVGAITLTAHVTTPSNPTYIPTGTVTFNYSASSGTGSACVAVALDSSGTATCSITLPAVGTVSYTADYSGDGATAQQNSSLLYLTGLKDPTTIGNVSITPVTATKYSLSVTVTPVAYAIGSLGQDQGTTDGTVTFLYSTSTTTTFPMPSSTACTQTIPSNLAAQTAATPSCPFSATPGTNYEFIATYAGNNDNLNAPSSGQTPPAPQSLTVAKFQTKTTLGVSPDASGATITYGTQETATATVSNIPSSDTSGTGTVLYTYAATGAAATCIGVGQTNPAPLTLVQTNGGVMTGTATSCTYVPSKTQGALVATYQGDSQTLSSSSSTATSTNVQYTITPAATSTTISVSAAQNDPYVGVPVTVTATITDASNTQAAPLGSGSVVFTDNGNIASCSPATPAPVSGSPGTSVATCTVGMLAIDASQHTFGAVFCPSGSTVPECQNWKPGTEVTTTYTPNPDPTQISVSPYGSDTHPVSVSGGTSITVTATVQSVVPAGSQPATPAGTVSFYENGNSTNCMNIAVQAGSSGTGTATCQYKPTAGGQDALVAIFTPSTSLPLLTTASDTMSNPSYFSVSGLPTSTSLTLTPGSLSISFGTPITLSASVTSSGAPVSGGTVAFDEVIAGTGSSTVQPIPGASGSPICQNVAVNSGTATCTLPVEAVSGTPYTFEASYAYAGGAYEGSTSLPASVTIASASTSLQAAVGPDPANAANMLITATVTNTSAGSLVSPEGNADFLLGTTSIANCSKVPLVAGANGTSIATCSLAIPTTTETFSVTVAPSADFAAPPSTTATFTLGGTCSTAFQTLWNAVGTAGKVLTFTPSSLGGASTLSATATGLLGTCTPNADIPLLSIQLSFLNGSVSGTGLVGYIADTTVSTNLCITSGSLQFPAGWKLPGITLDNAGDLCFNISSTTANGGTLGTISSGVLHVTGVTLPFGTPDASTTYDLTLSFTNGTTQGIAVHIGPSIVPSASPYVDTDINVTWSGSSTTATGTLSLGNVPFGSTWNGSFTVQTGTSGTINGGSASITLSNSGTYAPLPGLSLGGVSVTLSSTSGLTVSATGTFGSPQHPISLPVTGSYAAGTWSIVVGPTSLPGWTPITGLSFTATISGTVTIADSGVVTYDIGAGSAPTAGSSANPLATFSPSGSGVSLEIDCIALTYGIATPVNGCTGGGLSTPTDPMLSMQGKVSVGGSNGFSAGIGGTLDLRSGAFALGLNTTIATPTIQVAPGFTVTLQQLSVTGVGGALSVSGEASVLAPSLSSSPIIMTVSDTTGPLIIAVSNFSLSSLNVPLTGVFAYASAPVSAYNTGVSGIGTVSLSQGFNAFSLYQLDPGTASALNSLGFSVASGGTIFFSASWTPGSTPTFVATIASPANFPILSLPDGGSISGATLSFAGGSLTFTANGTIPIPAASTATLTMTITINTDGSFAGSVTVSNMTVFGANFGMIGTVSRSTGGTITADVASCTVSLSGCTKGPIPGPITPFSGVPVTISNLSFDLGTAGLSISGTLSADNVGSINLSGTVTSLSTWQLSLALSQAQSWTPAPGFTIDATLSGTLTDTFGAVTFVILATGTNQSPLLSIAGSGYSFVITSLGVGNGTPSSGCTVSKVGDLWVCVSGGMTLSLGSVSGSVTAAGTYDITAGTFTLTASIPSLSFSALNNAVTLSDPTFTISDTSGTFAVAITAPFTVTMPGGGTIQATAVIAYSSAGFVIGASVDLSQWIGSAGNSAYLYYASADMSNFATGSPTLGSINLTQGIDFAISIDLPQTFTSMLSHIGMSLPANTALAAVGTADFATDTYTFKVAISLGSGLTIFSTGGTSLVLNDGFVAVVLSPSVESLSLGLDTTLNLPSPGNGGAASSVGLTGALTVSDTGINLSLSLGNCTGTSLGWVNAFGLSGLTVKCAALQGGVSWGDGIPLPNVGFEGTITSLPSTVANVIGYMNNAPISFAFNFDPFLLSLSIGTANSGTPALEPFAYFGQGSLLEIDYASLYLCPEGATIAQTVYPAGFGLAFQASIEGVDLNVMANIGFAPPSIHFLGTLSSVTLGGLTVGPITVKLDASTSPLMFDFEFDGTLSLGPGGTDIGPALYVGGSLSASVAINISTSGISAFLWGNVNVQLGAYVPGGTCWWDGWAPYPCDYYWSYTYVNVTIGKTGFSVNSSGVTLEADGYSITFYYNGTASVSTRYTPGATSSGGSSNSGTSSVLLSYVPKTGAPVRIASRGTTVHFISSGMATTNPIILAGTYRSAGPIRSGTQAISDVTAVPNEGAAIGTWIHANAISQPVSDSVVVPLLGGDVLLAGGFTTQGNPTSQAWIFNPATGSWIQTGSMNEARLGAMAVRLSDGNVLVAGGIGSQDLPLSSAEIYQVATGTWHEVGKMSTSRAFASINQLSNGEILVAGGLGLHHTPLSSAEIFHSDGGNWTSAPAMHSAHAFAASTILPGGNILIAGGLNSTDHPTAAAEVYSSSRGSWNSAGNMSQPRFFATAVLLPNGTAFIVGDGPSADMYDPATNGWKQSPGMQTTRVMPSVSQLPNGDVLVAGGSAGTTMLESADVFDVQTDTWKNAGTLPFPEMNAKAVTLSNSEVLLVGGSQISTTNGIALTPLKGVTVFRPNASFLGIAHVQVPKGTAAVSGLSFLGRVGNVLITWQALMLVILVCGACCLVVGVLQYRKRWQHRAS
ncbi:MAG: kelch repeat-containing protein [Candidatus Dormibacteria bacterium]